MRCRCSSRWCKSADDRFDFTVVPCAKGWARVRGHCQGEAARTGFDHLVLASIEGELEGPSPHALAASEVFHNSHRAKTSDQKCRAQPTCRMPITR
jgi:hypothetical protein